MREQGPLALGPAETFQKSALFRAYSSGNQKCLDLIMEQMAQIRKNGSKNFSQILIDSNDANGFAEYIGNLPF
jgi:hypothetical protein